MSRINSQIQKKKLDLAEIQKEIIALCNLRMPEISAGSAGSEENEPEVEDTLEKWI